MISPLDYWYPWRHNAIHLHSKDKHSFMITLGIHMIWHFLSRVYKASCNLAPLCPLTSQLLGMHSGGVGEEGGGCVCVCVCVCVCSLLSCVRLLATPWTVAHHAPLSMEFFRQEDWSRLPFPSPGDLPNPGIEPRAPEFQAGFFTIWANTLDLLKLFLNAVLSHTKGHIHHVEIISPAF